ncbi:MAG: GNAT family N-acetyltransferase [Solirubrobacterales bacterium]
MSREVRRAEPGEELAVAGVHVRAWLAAYRGLIDDDYLDGLRAEDRAAVHSFDAPGPNAPETLLAVEGDEILGFVAFGPSRDADAPEAGEIFALYIDPPRWGTGVGRLLMREARRCLRERGHTEGTLWVLEGNEPAERFYRSEGWERDGAEREEDPYGPLVTVRRFRRHL